MRSASPRGDREGGFTLIELLVCVAILAAVLIPIIEATSAGLRRHERQDSAIESLRAQHAALVVARRINPMAEPVGRRELTRDSFMTWQAMRLSRPVRSLRFLGGEGAFRVALFQVEVATFSARAQRRFTVMAVGWAPLDGRLDRLARRRS